MSTRENPNVLIMLPGRILFWDGPIQVTQEVFTGMAQVALIDPEDFEVVREFNENEVLDLLAPFDITKEVGPRRKL